MSVCPAETQISLGIQPVWLESSLSACRKLVSLATHWARSEDSAQTGRMHRLIRIFAGRTSIMLVLSCRGSNVQNQKSEMHMLLYAKSIRYVMTTLEPYINISMLGTLCIQNTYWLDPDFYIEFKTELMVGQSE